MQNLFYFFAGGKNDWQTPFNQPTKFLLRMRIMAAAVVDGCGWLSTESTVLGIFPAKTACTGIF